MTGTHAAAGTSLDGQVALVTGAARGIGRAVALALADAGADLVLVDVCDVVSDDVEYAPATPADLAEVVASVEQKGRRALSHVVDVRDGDALERAVHSSTDELGGLDVVLANAGYVSWHRFWEMTSEQWQSMMDVVLTGTFHTLKAAAPIMIEQGRGGAVVVTSSAAGLKALPGQMHYTTAKHGLTGLTKAAALELGPYGIRVNSLHPFVVDTHMGRRSESMLRLLADNPTYARSLGRVLDDPPALTPDDLAQAVLYLVSPATRLMTGHQLRLDSGQTLV